MNDELKPILPCPFCGGKGYDTFSGEWRYVRCAECGSQGKKVSVFDSIDSGSVGIMNLAIDAWNLRTDHSIAKQKVMVDKIIKVFRESFPNFKNQEVSSKVNFVNEYDLDDLDLVEFLMKVEDEFGKEIFEEESYCLTTLDSLAKLVLNKR
jgi:acyl carrier protein